MTSSTFVGRAAELKEIQLLATDPKTLVYIGTGVKNYYDQFVVEPNSELGIGSNGRGQNKLGRQLAEIRHDFELNACVESASFVILFSNCSIT